MRERSSGIFREFVKAENMREDVGPVTWAELTQRAEGYAPNTQATIA